MSQHAGDAGYVPCRHLPSAVIPRAALDLPHAAHVALIRDPVCTVRMPTGHLCTGLSVTIRDGAALCRRHAEADR